MGRLLPSRLERFGVKGGDVLIETGTDGGTDLMQTARIFETVHSVELDPRRYMRALRRLRHHGNIILHLGDSRSVLPDIIDPDRETVFWLDAHFVAGEDRVSPQGVSQCPLLGELEAIFSFDWRVKPVIICDDARMFGEWFWRRRGRDSDYRKADWPRMSEIENLAQAHGMECQEIKGAVLIR